MLRVLITSAARVEKRPLLRPAIPSKHSGASQQKIVYVSTHTPFLSAVKRVEKLLHLADKRLVQSAATNAKQNNAGGAGKRKRGAGGGDEILEIAEEVERAKGKRRKVGDDGMGTEKDDDCREEVILKGTGKAIHRVLELALWFQQRDQDYTVRLKTGSVGTVDDVTIDEDVEGGKNGDAVEGAESADAGAGADQMDVDTSTVVNDANQPERDEPMIEAGGRTKKRRKRGKGSPVEGDVPETRIRYASFIEAAVSLR